MSVVDFISNRNIRNNIFGLRDFYNMVKYVCANLNLDDIEGEKTNEVIAYSFYRNFGGFDNV